MYYSLEKNYPLWRGSVPQPTLHSVGWGTWLGQHLMGPKIQLKIWKKSILPKFDSIIWASEWEPLYLWRRFKHFVINLSKKVIITAKSKGTGGLIIVFRRIGDLKDTFWGCYISCSRSQGSRHSSHNQKQEPKYILQKNGSKRPFQLSAVVRTIYRSLYEVQATN